MRDDLALHLRAGVGVSGVAPQHHFAPIPTICGTGIDGGASLHRHLSGCANVATALPVSTHQNSAASSSAFGFNFAVASEGDVVTLQDNLPAFVDQAVGLKAATVFNDSALELVRCNGGQDDLSVGGKHREFVLHQTGHGGCCGGDASQAFAAHQVQSDVLARRHDDRARSCQDHARVLDLRGQHGNVAVQSRC